MNDSCKNNVSLVYALLKSCNLNQEIEIKLAD